MIVYGSLDAIIPEVYNMRSIKTGSVLAIAIMLLCSVSSCKADPRLPDGLYAKIDTVKGSITISLAYEQTPLAVANFVGLAEGSLEGYKGKRFYDGLSFHRVEPGFVVQAGDPMGDGTGDPGYNFPDEFDPSLRHDSPGIVAMANHGPDTNGSQFYISLEAAEALDDSYTIFGRVVDGMDTVLKLTAGDVMTKVTILRLGSAAKAFETDQMAWNRYYGPAAEGSKARSRAARKDTVEAIQAAWPGLELRPDGILSKTLQEGTGPGVRRYYLVNVHYKGMLPSGQVFDQSILHGGPLELELGTGQVILGWDIVLAEMKKGEKRLVAIPPEYAYGIQGVPGVIPPNSFILFELELADFTE
ncbi:MAG: peptidylprolyl isomerase [Spirochaetia bacterium]|jgi:peptidylprolyl isomerase|nr:peptidylprolyl isomerase [Spirochaetia bacterium]